MGRGEGEMGMGRWEDGKGHGEGGCYVTVGTFTQCGLSSQSNDTKESEWSSRF